MSPISDVYRHKTRRAYYVSLVNRDDLYLELGGTGPWEIFTPEGVMKINYANPMAVPRDELVRTNFAAPFLAWTLESWVTLSPLNVRQEVPQRVYKGADVAYIPVDRYYSYLFKLHLGSSLLDTDPVKSYMEPVYWDGEEWYASPCLFRPYYAPIDEETEELDFEEGVYHPFVFDPELRRVVRK